jgi:hypothetical protein
MSKSSGHLATSFGATLASSRAALTMRRLVLPALLSAAFADLCAQRTNALGKGTISCHRCAGEPAHLCAFDV